MCTKFIEKYPETSKEQILREWEQLRESYRAHEALSNTMEGEDERSGDASMEKNPKIEDASSLVVRCNCVERVGRIVTDATPLGEYTMMSDDFIASLPAAPLPKRPRIEEDGEIVDALLTLAKTFEKFNKDITGRLDTLIQLVPDAKKKKTVDLEEEPKN